jgi:hypothetical protein
MPFLVALAFVLQDPSAEETLKKIEHAIDSPKTLSFKVSIEGTGKLDGMEYTSKLSGSIFLKGVTRASIAFTGTANGKPKETRFLSDGTRCQLWSDHQRGGEIEATDALGRQIRTGFARGGVAQLDLILPIKTVPGKTPPEPLDLDKLLLLSDFKPGAEEKPLRMITYTLKTPDEEDGTYQVRLWYDPNSYLPKKRVSVLKAKDAEGTITETYEDWAVNSEIPDGTFTFPGK